MKHRAWFIIGMVLFVPVMSFYGCHGTDDSDSGSSSVTAPSNLAYTKVVNSSTSATTNIIFTWSDNSDDETAFILYVREFGATDWTLFDSGIPADVTSYSVSTSTLINYNYQFCLIAYNGDDSISSDESNILTVNLP
ncbi:MAG: hypothetical protein V1701_07125 [Planctomycetota bacterium]